MSKKHPKKVANLQKESSIPKQESHLLSNEQSLTPSRKSDYISIALLILAIGIAFIGALNNQFVDWDDQVYVKENPIIQDAGFYHLGKIFTSSVALNYHPITILTLMLNALFFGKGAASYIIVNILIHTINTILVFVFIKKILPNKVLVSFFTAFLFAIHPLRVESVVWISERKDVLYTCFFLAGCLTYINFLNNNSRKSLIYTYLFFVLSCLSKAQAVVFPLVLMLLDYWFSNNLFDRKRILQKLPLFAISLVFGFIALNIQSGGTLGGLIKPIEGQANAISISYNFFDKLQIGTLGFVAYLWKLFVPLDLTPLYPYLREADGSTPAYYKLGLLLFPLIIGLAIWSYRRYKVITFGVFFYLICIVLVLQFLSVGVALMADRYSYLPIIGILFMIAFGADKLANATNKYAVWGILAVFGIWCIYLTSKQVKVWKDTIALFSQRININPNDVRALEVRGQTYFYKQQNDLALVDLEKAYSLGMSSEQGLMTLGMSYGNAGNKPKAAEFFTKVIGINPKNIEAYSNRANAYFPAKDAITDYEKAISLAQNAPNPDWVAYLGVCYANAGDIQRGLEQLNKAIGLQKTPQVGHLLNRAIMFRQTGNTTAAIQDLKSVILQEPNNQQAIQMLRELGGG
jgi:protein O-mannosyl-transferase